MHDRSIGKCPPLMVLSSGTQLIDPSKEAEVFEEIATMEFPFEGRKFTKGERQPLICSVCTTVGR